jgi:cobalt-zinc-cadmium efflux system membrane fusion protein
MPRRILHLLLWSSLLSFAACDRWRSSPEETGDSPLGNSRQEDLASATPQRSTADAGSDSSAAALVQMTVEQESAAGIVCEEVKRGPMVNAIDLTGKVSLNEDQLAHVFPLVEGVVDSVLVQFGQKVRKGEPLVTVRSREVGQAKLDLMQYRMVRDFAQSRDQWSQQVAANTLDLIAAMRSNATMDQIEQQFRDRPMGEYRNQLMNAYVAFFRSSMDLQRLGSLPETGAVPAKQRQAAESAVTADRASLQAALEQIGQDASRAAQLASQALKEADLQVAIALANLQILGYDPQELEISMADSGGEGMALYPIRSPLDGTVIEKDVVLLERAHPDQQMLTIADLSTVWIKTDIYEQQLPWLRDADRRRIQFRSEAWPGQTFEAEVFFTGEIVDQATRTVSMIARAENSERLLKPGMFVTVTIPGNPQSDAIQLPSGAILEHAGKSFVFVRQSPGRYLRKDVIIGRRSGDQQEIVSGVTAGDPVVVSGAFTLKSLLLEAFLGEE